MRWGTGWGNRKFGCANWRKTSHFQVTWIPTLASKLNPRTRAGEGIMVATTSLAMPVASGRFFFGMAHTCGLIAVLGFIPTYWAPLVGGTLSVAPVIHLHGLLFTAWAVFFVVQAHLATSGRIARHRALGLVGISLASLMLLVGLAAAIHSVETQIAAGQGARGRGFMIVPVTTILFFACTIAIAIAKRRRTEVHRRLMLVGSAAILMAAVARLVRLAMTQSGQLTGPPPIEFSILPALITDLLIVAAMIHDRRTQGRVHPVYWIAGGTWLAIQLGRIPFSKTTQWHAAADWLLSF
jgi:uncharacterized membrane protein YozB (DUF420 family)